MLAALVACGVGGAPQAAGTHALAIAAVVLSKNICRFNTAASTINVTIDPASGAAATGSGNVSFKCVGSAPTATWAISNNSGMYGASASALRMRHAVTATEFLPYTLSYPASGSAPKNVDQTISVSVSVAPAVFQNALTGNYSDSVVLSILP